MILKVYLSTLKFHKWAIPGPSFRWAIQGPSFNFHLRLSFLFPCFIHPTAGIWAISVPSVDNGFLHRLVFFIGGWKKVVGGGIESRAWKGGWHQIANLYPSTKSFAAAEKTSAAARQSITLGPCCCTGYRCSMCTVPKSVWVKKMGEYVQTRVSLGTCPKLTMWYALTQMRKGYYGHISQIRIE